MKQKDVSELLGYESSYICSLETGAKGVPKKDFIDRLIKAMGLQIDEIESLKRVVEITQGDFTLSSDAPFEEYEFRHRFCQRSGRMSTTKLRIFLALLDMPDATPSCNSIGLIRPVARRSAIEKELPM